MLAAHIPYLEVDRRVRRRERNGSDILSDCRDCPQIRIRRGVCAFYLLEESCFAGVVKAKQKNRVFYVWLGGVSAGLGEMHLAFFTRRMEIY